MVSNSLLENIKYSEGYSDKLYVDDKGFHTIGYGTNIETISKKEAEYLLKTRINNSISEVDSLLGVDVITKMTEEQRDAIYELCYWIGLPSLTNFKNMLKYIKAYNWVKASEEMMDSKIGREYTTRTKRLAYKLRGGL